MVLGLAARLELDLALGPRPAFFDLEAALALGVQLVAEEDRQVGDPEPDQQGDQPAERAVGLVVGAEVGDVEGEQRPRRATQTTIATRLPASPI